MGDPVPYALYCILLSATLPCICIWKSPYLPGIALHWPKSMSQMSRSESKKISDDYEVIDILGRDGFSIKERDQQIQWEEKLFCYQDSQKIGFHTFEFPAKPSCQTKGYNHFGTACMDWTQTLISDALLTNEILVMRRIVEDVSTHPNFIHMYDVYEDMNGVHLVLELCSGGELFDRIVAHAAMRGIPYSEVKAAQVVRKIASGLDAVHRANIIHRDLKPENCLFLNNSEHSPLKIMDFDLSSVEDFTDPIVAMFGSIHYVSPEALS